jgi:hypothetical protein
VGDRLERLISGSAALALPSWAPGLIQV